MTFRTKADYEEMVREKLSPPLLEIVIHEILSELSKDTATLQECKKHLKILPKSK